MTKLISAIALCVLITASANARDTRHNFPLKAVFDNPEYAERLEGVRFYFGDQPHPTVERTILKTRTNKKTNAFKKEDQVACEWALMSALVALHKRALAEGGNAVINIESNYKSQPFRSDSEYQCGAGAIMAGVALKGEVVKLVN